MSKSKMCFSDSAAPLWNKFPSFGDIELVEWYLYHTYTMRLLCACICVAGNMFFCHMAGTCVKCVNQLISVSHAKVYIGNILDSKVLTSWMVGSLQCKSDIKNATLVSVINRHPSFLPSRVSLRGNGIGRVCQCVCASVRLCSKSRRAQIIG